MVKVCELPAFVLAGGFGTRLRSAIGETQKAVAPVGEKSFLFHQLKNWHKQGLREFIFLLHYKADSVLEQLDHYVSAEFPNLNYKYVIESEALGTGGSVLNAVKQFEIASPFWVLNADTWVPNFVEFFSIQPIAQVGVCEVNDARRYGTVEFDKQSLVTKFTEKSHLNTAGWVNAGVNLLNEECFEYRSERVFSLEERILQPLALNGKLKAVPLKEEFIDIGVPIDYKKFQNQVSALDD